MRGWGDRAWILLAASLHASHATIGAMALTSVTLGNADPKTARVHAGQLCPHLESAWNHALCANRFLPKLEPEPPQREVPGRRPWDDERPPMLRCGESAR